VITRSAGMVRWEDERGELLFWGTEEAWARLQEAAKKDMPFLVAKIDDAALRHARTHPRDPRNPPHHLRCSAMDEHGRRCIKGDRHTEGHDFTPHGGGIP